jgi:ubiquinone/menaquinone biosynthesis C-methylase UbiE
MTTITMSSQVCMSLTRLFYDTPLRRFNLRNKATGARFESRENYVADRVSNMEEYQTLFGSFCDFRGKTVLDLGCSAGYILASFLDQAPFTAIGADIDDSALAMGRAAYGDRITFIKSSAEAIPLPDQSVDIIYAIDTVEHLQKLDEILLDCHRVLRPGGLFLIHFHPWLGPYGSHLEDIIPFPWAHAVFSMDTLLGVAAELYDSPTYTAACYWYDAQTGERRPNPYVDRQRWKEFLNQVTLARLRRTLATMPFRTLHYEKIGFGGKAYKVGRSLRGLAQVPGLDEFFTKAAFIVLRRG